MEEQNYLQDAKYCIERAERSGNPEYAQLNATLAAANAQIALVEQVKGLVDLLTAIVKANEEGSDAR